MNRKHFCIIIAAFFILSVSALAQRDEQALKRETQKSDDKLRLETKLVSMTVSVTDRYGRMVTGLERDNFEIYDDDVRQDIAIFSNEDAPVTLGIVYDISGSMSDLTAASFQRLRQFFKTSHEDDEYFIIAFSNKPKLVQDFTVSPNEILNRVIFVKAGGNTALYDAVYLAVEKVRQGRHQKKALLLLSDGLENNSRYSGKELNALLKESDAQVFTVGLSEGSDGAYTLKTLAQWSGGKAFFPPMTTRWAISIRRWP